MTSYRMAARASNLQNFSEGSSSPSLLLITLALTKKSWPLHDSPGNIEVGEKRKPTPLDAVSAVGISMLNVFSEESEEQSSSAFKLAAAAQDVRHREEAMEWEVIRLHASRQRDALLGAVERAVSDYRRRCRDLREWEGAQVALQAKQHKGGLGSNTTSRGSRFRPLSARGEAPVEDLARKVADAEMELRGLIRRRAEIQAEIRRAVDTRRGR